MGTKMGDLFSRGNEMGTQGALTLFTERTWGFWLSIQGFGRKSGIVFVVNTELTEARERAVRMKKGRDKNASDEK